jgi:trehalose synthase
MLRRVQLKKKSLDDYREVAGTEAVERVRQLARPLQGLRILHVNSTGEGGGVAELLTSLVPLMRDVGLDAEWQLLCHDDPFFEVTKGFHNALQGKRFALTEEHRERYLCRNRTCAAMVEGSYDVVLAHDPQPAGLRSFSPRSPTIGSGAATSTLRNRTLRSGSFSGPSSRFMRERSSRCGNSCRRT